MSTNKALSAKVVVKCPAGLHARPAARIASMADEARGAIWLEAKGETADACGIMDILALSCVDGTHVLIRIEDLADKPVMDKIVAFFASGFEGVN